MKSRQPVEDPPESEKPSRRTRRPRSEAPASTPAKPSPAAPASTFAYTAVGSDGQIEEGKIVAVSEQEVVDRLRRLGKRPVDVTATRSSIFATEMSIPGFGPRVKKSELAVVARQFSTMVGAGIPLVRSLAVLGDQSENPLLRQTLSDMEISVSSGDSLSQSMERHPKVFDQLFVSMVRAGEAAGALDVVLEQLASTVERSVAVNSKIRSAMSYPIAVLVMVTGVIAAMLVFVVPVFSGIYDDLDGTLPLPTRALVFLSSVLTDYLFFVVVAVVALVVGTRRYLETPRGERRWHELKLRLPLFGPLVHKSALARLGRTLSVLTRAGVPVLETLRIAANTTGNRVVTDALLDAVEGVRNGETLASNMAEHPIFPPMVLQLVSVGEESGSLEEMLDVVGRTYEGEVETAVAGFAALIEPLLMAVIGLVVGGMVISLYLPMFRIIDLVQ